MARRTHACDYKTREFFTGDSGKAKPFTRVITTQGFILHRFGRLRVYLHPPYMKVCTTYIDMCPLCEIPLVYRPPTLYHTSMAIRYTDLEITTERGAICYPCSEYKGMVDCPNCGATFCVFCADGCPECGEEIVFS